MAITNDFFSALNDPKAAMWSAGVAFNRSNPLPLDKWSVFQTMDEAIAYAESNAVAYPGQIIAVYDNNEMLACVLTEVEGKLVPEAIGVMPEGDDITIEIIDGKIALVGFKEAENGAQLTKGADGKLSWVVPSNETVEGLQTLVGTLQTDIKDLQDDIKELNNALNPTDEEGNPVEGGLVSDVENLENAVGEEAEYDEEGNLVKPATGIYKDIADIEDQIGDPANSELNKEATGLYAALELKADKATTYTKTEVDTLVAEKIVEADHLRRIIVDKVEDIEITAEDAPFYIYMVPSGLKEDDNKYYEYVVIEYDEVNEDGSTTPVRSLERVGSWEVNLDDYALKSEVSSLAETVAANKEAAEKAVSDEKARAEAAEKANADAIEAEQARAELAEKANADAIQSEKERAELAEQGLIDDLAEMDAAKANKEDVYTKNEVYTKSEVYTKGEADQAIADKISEVNGGESAGEVLGQLNAYKKIVNMEVWGDENGSGVEGNSRIDILNEQVSDISDALDNKVEVVQGSRLINSDEVALLEKVANGEFNNFISAVNPSVFKVEDGTLDLVSVPAAALENALGNFSSLPHASEDFTLVDEINNLYNLLTWNDMSV